jgi:hypothetical protein
MYGNAFHKYRDNQLLCITIQLENETPKPRPVNGKNNTLIQHIKLSIIEENFHIDPTISTLRLYMDSASSLQNKNTTQSKHVSLP